MQVLSIINYAIKVEHVHWTNFLPILQQYTITCSWISSLLYSGTTVPAFYLLLSSCLMLEHVRIGAFHFMHWLLGQSIKTIAQHNIIV